jgi:uncharacterized protein (DUF2147 family)
MPERSVSASLNINRSGDHNSRGGRRHSCWRTALLAGALSIGTSLGGLAAADHSFVGRWRTIDDKTGQPRGIVRVYEREGELFAAVEKGLWPGDEGRTCTKCTDERRNQPIVGLVIMRGMKLIDGEYRGGDILDPDSGAIYRCKLRLDDDGRKLKVRGFLGFSLFGRTQTWEREE